MGLQMRVVQNPAQLVTGVQRGDRGAEARLVDAWLPVVLGWCNRMCGPAVNPEDVAQDVLIEALTHADEIREPDRFPGWIFQVTRSQIRRRRRSAWVRGWLPGFMVERHDPAIDALAHCEQNEVARGVQRALEALPEAQREVIVLCDIEGRTAKEASGLVGASIGTVKSRLRLGRSGLRRAAIREGLRPTAPGGAPS